MKKRIAVLFSLFVFVGCLVLPSPHTNWYKPTQDAKKINFLNDKGINDVFYKFESRDSIDFYISLNVGVIPKQRILVYDLKINNNKSKQIEIFCDSIYLKSKNFKMNYDCQTSSKILKIKPRDSLCIFYKREFKSKDWYRKVGKSDTLIFDITIKGSNYLFPFYYNHKNRIETYPL